LKKERKNKMEKFNYKKWVTENKLKLSEQNYGCYAGAQCYWCDSQGQQQSSPLQWCHTNSGMCGDGNYNNSNPQNSSGNVGNVTPGVGLAICTPPPPPPPPPPQQGCDQSAWGNYNNWTTTFSNNVSNAAWAQPGNTNNQPCQFLNNRITLWTNTMNTSGPNGGPVGPNWANQLQCKIEYVQNTLQPQYEPCTPTTASTCYGCETGSQGSIIPTSGPSLSSCCHQNPAYCTYSPTLTTNPNQNIVYGWLDQNQAAMHCPGNVSESINHMGSIKESTLSKIKYTIKESKKQFMGW
jgi:hypothetical protein